MTSVLLVEDDNDIRAAYNYALSKAGFAVTEASDGAKAAEYIEKLRPDVVLLDMLMPGMSGLDFLRQTEVASRFPDTKVVAVSNIDTPRVVQQAKELGVTEYIIKVETTPRELVELVGKLAKVEDDAH
ncbi:MAG TPA: response regulator [Candidatus Saccharimonadia bacterium]